MLWIDELQKNVQKNSSPNFFPGTLQKYTQGVYSLYAEENLQVVFGKHLYINGKLSI